jgi:magnesium transporter
VDRLAARVKSSVIPWEFVDLIDRDPARRVKLKIEQERLSKMHPSDIADILEELAPAERQALFRSLDEEVAAEALEEVEPKMQKALIADLDSESVAGHCGGDGPGRSSGFALGAY